MRTGVDAIRARIVRLEQIHASYLAYLKDRIAEADWHGGWDACINLAETEDEMSGLKFALEAVAAA